MSPDNRVRVCLVASAGGHLTQLLTLMGGWSRYPTFVVTTTEHVRCELQKYGNVYVVGECNRYHPWLAIKVLIRCIKPLMREKPDVVISTGAAAGCFTCFWAKMFGAKVIWIDSLTNIKKLSLSGWVVRRIADLFIVQWPELNKRYKRVEYLGKLV